MLDIRFIRENKGLIEKSLKDRGMDFDSASAAGLLSLELVAGLDLVLFDLRHVNDALINHKAEKVQGIIGADILKKGNAIIDYKSMSLFLK